MRQRILGRTGISVSEIAFGGVEIGMPYGIGVHSQADMLNETDTIQLLRAAVDQGINFFDTARMYGYSEDMMGKAFSGLRDQVVLSTKCRHFRINGGPLPPPDELRKMITDSMTESLSALQTDHVDVFMLHQADEEILAHETIAEMFSALKAKGMTRAIGASTYTTAETAKAMDAGIWDVIQLPFNLLDQRQHILLEEASEKDLGIVIRSVLLKGLLSDRGKNLHPVLIEVENHIRKYHALLNDAWPDLPSLATKFALSFEAISAVLVGIDRMAYLRQAVRTANGHYLDAEQVTQARELAYPDPAFLNLPYWDKMGWLK